MAPQESTRLLDSNDEELFQFPVVDDAEKAWYRQKESWLLAAFSLLVVGCMAFREHDSLGGSLQSNNRATGPYYLVKAHEGESFFDGFAFYEGADSLGSAGYLTYLDQKDAGREGLTNVTREHLADPFDPSGPKKDQDMVYLASQATEKGPRDSVRLEGKQRYNRGLFILDLRHLPTGCGVWPAFWMTDEDVWPDHGEIDIVEGINTQARVKTAMHTSSECNMYAQVPEWSMTGSWDRATGLPDRFTGIPDTKTNIPADDCSSMAPHRWGNQGCVIGSESNRTLGKPLNDQGGGVFVLEWDPASHYIRSWAYTPHTTAPTNLQEAIATAHTKHPVTPDPTEWGAPYANFAIGDTTTCSADHFQNMRLVINLAFCGMVAGNRFLTDCPALGDDFGPEVDFDPIWTCNNYIKSEPKALEEAYFKLGGVYVYQRELE